MKQLFSATTYLLFVFLVSCESKSDNKEQVETPAVLPATTSSISPANNDSLPASNTGVTLNPQHGQPGHRCDIAVGAPLNTPVANSGIQPTNTPTITPSNAETKKTTPNSSNGTTALNPQHGEPGHRCDIAVGAPLNSKPTQ